jgi:predicted aspartyl protease
MLLDTGGAGSLIDKAAAERLAVPIARGFRASVANSSNLDVAVVPSARVGVAGARIQTRLVVPDLMPLQPIFGAPVEGILGGDYLRRYVVALDYSTHRMTIHDADAYQPPKRAVGIPMTLVGGIPFIEVSVSLPNGKSVNGSFLVDSGGAMDLHVHKPIADRIGLVEGLTSLEETGVGMGGASARAVVRGALAHVGQFRMTKPLVAITADPAGLRANAASVGLIGMGLLSKFHVAFDYRRERLWLTANASSGTPNVYDASGVLLRSDPPNFSVPFVSRVRQNSPADVAGVLRGDLIIGIDGRHTKGTPLQHVRTALNQPDRTIRLTLLRGGQTMEVTLKTRELLP